MNKKIKIESKSDNQYIKAICYYPSTEAQRDSIMKIELIDIENIGGISKLNLDELDPRLNIICGVNGIGKTTILDVIANSFSFFQTDTLTVKQGNKSGKIKIKIDSEKEKEKEIKIRSTSDEVCMDRDGFDLFNDDYKNNILYIKTNRVFNYKKLDSISIDPKRRPDTENYKGIHNNDLKNFFALRSLHAGNSNSGISEIELYNFKVAEKAISLLDDRFTYKSTKIDNEIIINTPTGDIFLEMLSSGFKSILFIVIGIIQEIEYRFKDEKMKVDDFEGVVLIDEIELHLHPKWQGRACKVLTKIFPKSQFIVTTHSPHVVQSAETNQVVALSGEDGNLEKRTLDIAPNGFEGWTIEEILTDVMGMSDTRTKWFRDNVELFEKALDEDNFVNAKNVFSELESKLHPNNRDLALFRFQLDMLEGRTK